MQNSTSQILTQRMEHRLSAQQIQMHSIIALHSDEILAYIEEEMALNPALECDLDQPSETENSLDDVEFESDDYADEFINEGTLGEDYDYTDYMDREAMDDYKTQSDNWKSNEDNRATIFKSNENYCEEIFNQFSLLVKTDRERELGLYLIHSLDHNGYLPCSIADIADEISFRDGILVNESELELILSKLQHMKPLGLGARTIQECLLLQLGEKKSTEDRVNATRIIQNCFDELSNEKHQSICTKLDLTQDDFDWALEEIKALNPYPAKLYGQQNEVSIAINPDFNVIIENDSIELTLNQGKCPPLKINTDFQATLQDYEKVKNKKTKELTNYLREKVDRAQWFIDALKQRESMMIRVARAIVFYQKEYFITGDSIDLKPLILKDIAKQIGSDISTVSRIANSKYLATSFGNILIKDLFVQGIPNLNGEIVSTTILKAEIKECIEREDKSNPFGDHEIVDILSEKRYVISRRTVAKYRDELNIPNKGIRKVA